MSTSLYIQYGCGWSAPENWKNFDASPTLRFERLPFFGKLYTKNKSRFPVNVEYGDIVKGLSVLPGSCSAVYCSHVLEHLSLEDLRKALQNTHKLLRGKGIFRFVVPDLEYAIKKYTADSSNEAALAFMRETSLGHEKRSRGMKDFFYSWMGNSQHLWMWDYKSIIHELKEAGFNEIRRAEFGDSSDTIFAQVEDPDRWKDGLGVECRK